MATTGGSADSRWRVFVDTGGTFTDCLAVDPGGGECRIKVLSSSSLRGHVVAGGGALAQVEAPWAGVDGLATGFDFRLLERAGAPHRVRSHRADPAVLELDPPLPDDLPVGAAFEVRSPEPAPLLATRVITGTPSGDPLPPMSMRLGTTRGTNALLTRSGDRPVLFVTRGFGDLLEIGTQARPELFALRVRKPASLAGAVVEVWGRLDARGLEIEPLDLESLASEGRRLVRAGHRTAAVALVHGDRNPAYERAVADLLREIGFERVSVSSELSPTIGLLRRATTAVVDAYLAAPVGDYLARIADAIRGGRLHVMTSAGGLVGADRYQPKDSLLSGPAGGVAGAAQAGRRVGRERVIAFDMGGTSTDVARYDEDFEYVFEHAVGDALLASPALAIESVAAGGGSVCGFADRSLRVGPDSAGADPGPACYGAGGPLSITDVNLLMGRLQPARFEIPVDPAAAQRALDAVRADIAASRGGEVAADPLLQGFLDIANQKMADAIREVSLRRGVDPAQYVLVAFGGAGPQHALAVAGRLGMDRVVVPRDPGLLSAQGMAVAAIERFAEEQVLERLDDVAPELPGRLERLAARAADELAAEGVREPVIRRRIASLRFVGQDAAVEVEVTLGADLEGAFGAQYREVFGHVPADREVELVSLRVVSASAPAGDAPERCSAGPRDPDPVGTSRALFHGRWSDVPVWQREDLPPGARVRGPGLVAERYSTLVLEPGWSVTVQPHGDLEAHRDSSVSRTAALPDRPGDAGAEAVRLELFTHRFDTIARQMGEALRRTAVSTNVKERLDFSCAVLDPDGELVVNAPHIPVHLGSLGLCVRAVTAALDLESGDVAVTNHPAAGGSHLPDITVVTPAHDTNGRLLGYLASRAHHAEIGGIVPGSMPAGATRLVEEGAVIPPTVLVRGGHGCWEALEASLKQGPHPTRALGDNLADLRAAVAANQAGARALVRMAAEHGAAGVAQAMEDLKDRAHALLVDTLASRLPGDVAATEVLDDGAEIRVAIRASADRIEFDFTGTSGVHPGNLNATPAVVHSAVLYVLRLMVEQPLPLNEGLLRAVTIRIPPGMLDPPFGDDPAAAPAVMGGNVEVSQRLVNAMLRALGLCADSQGTMNNVVFGDEDASYYETVCGGTGAGPGFDGTHAVHSHMTNTRITDVEVLEHRFPVRVERFAVRRGSGGEGRYRGGDGVVREITFLAPLTLSLLTQHRDLGPAGAAGGADGLVGAQRLVRAGSTSEKLDAVDACDVEPGDWLVLETPGGGGWGTL